MWTVASLWPVNGAVIKLWVGFWSHTYWLRTKAPSVIAQGEEEGAEGGGGLTQNLLLGWAAGLQLVRELCRHLWTPLARW